LITAPRLPSLSESVSVPWLNGVTGDYISIPRVVIVALHVMKCIYTGRSSPQPVGATRVNGLLVALLC